jgi:hypothetical protein
MKSCARAALGVAATAAMLEATVISCGSNHDHSDLSKPEQDDLQVLPLATEFEQRCL